MKERFLVFQEQNKENNYTIVPADRKQKEILVKVGQIWKYSSCGQIKAVSEFTSEMGERIKMLVRHHMVDVE